MQLRNLKHIYFLGIGGIGMSSLARYFKHQGIQISGYDRTKTDLTTALEQEGILIHYQENISKISSDIDLVIYTPAIPKESIELEYIRNKNLNLKKRAEILGVISKEYQSIAVAGTHGKTTTSSMVAHIMHQSLLGCNAFVGGILSNYNTNLLLDKNSKWAVLEADEYDRSFMHLFPHIAIINSVDADHLDIYGTAEEVINSYVQFSKQVNKQGYLICHHNIKKYFPSCQYSFSYDNPDADIYVLRQMTNTKFEIHVKPVQETWTIHSPLPGKHNLENLLAASLACRLAGVSQTEIEKSLASFKGIKRRFELIANTETFTLIDDYAHHPTEIESAIKAAKDYYPNRKITVVFQPHLFSRTRDFYDEFAKSLSLADSLYLLEIYPAREKPIPGVNSTELLNKIKISHKKLVSKADLAEALKSELPSVILILGAGDIDVLVETVKQHLLKT